LGLAEYIQFAGYIPEDKLPMYYQSADAFVLPTKLLEGFGLIILESMACGTPVLATPVGGIVEIIKKFDKELLFDGTEPEHIYKGIKKFILEKRADKCLRERCRKFVEENYSWERFTQSTMDVYYEISRNKV
ncbi:MAG: glycosyltransferase family 4 protein, partial [Elusimicrobiota bacterium]